MMPGFDQHGIAGPSLFKYSAETYECFRNRDGLHSEAASSLQAESVKKRDS